jgi:hypothetical protein
MPAWSHHFVHLIAHAFVQWIVFLGTSPGGIIVQVMVLLLTEVQGGWWKLSTWRVNWKGGLRRAIYAVVSVWALVFIACIIITLYDDHISLVTQVSSLKTILSAETKQKETLQNALRDQKPVFKYLPEKEVPLKMFVSSQLLEKVGDPSTPSRKMFVLLAVTNKIVSPVDVLIQCSYDFMITEQPLVASQEEMTAYQMTRADQVSGHEVRYKMQSPAWGPDSPMEIPVLVTGFDNAKPFKCSITPQQ